MTELDKLVHERPADEIISIGSHDGYFFIGTAAEYEECIDEISAALKEHMNRTGLKNAKYFERGFAAAKQKADNGNMPTPEAIKLLAEAMSSTLKNAAYAARFKPVREREIVGSYAGIYKGTWKIIVEGDESGKYWSRDEYLADKERKGRDT